jgi:DNA-binding winged helix-turn-helix (wHTH) protein
LVNFGPFELETETRELRRFGRPVRLQAKPAQILELLLSRQGQLVRRDEMRQLLWPGDVFVDFESGLNTAVNRLRAALGDNADTPLYLETVPRLGYRFICPVDYVDTGERSSRSNGELLPRQGEWTMHGRLALATLLALICQCLFVYLHMQ